MVKETSVIKLSDIVWRLYERYPDLKDWNYQELYKSDALKNNSMDERKRWLGRRAKEIERTTQAIISFIEMGFEDRGQFPDSYLKRLIKYYLVLMDADKYTLNFDLANDEIFEGM